VNADASYRLFFALWPDPDLRARIVRAAATALASAGGRAVPPDNLHVTLAFLGEVARGRLGDVIAAAAAVPVERGEQPFDRIGTWGRGGALVLEATRPVAPLVALERALGARLKAAGLTLDRRPFRPHITLSRRPTGRWPPVPGGAGEFAGLPLRWSWDGFVLVASATGAAGSRYTPLERFPGPAMAG
jgi:2'-5' RNA ligase